MIPGCEDALEKGMAIHSGIPAWRIPWTEETGGLQSTGSQRVGYDLVTKPPKGERNASSSLKISEYIFTLYMQGMIMGGIVK